MPRDTKPLENTGLKVYTTSSGASIVGGVTSTSFPALSRKSADFIQRTTLADKGTVRVHGHLLVSEGEMESLDTDIDIDSESGNVIMTVTVSLKMKDNLAVAQSGRASA